MNQLSIQLGPNGYLYQVVLDIPDDERFRPNLQSSSDGDSALDGVVDSQIGYDHRAIDASVLADVQFISG